MCKKYIYFSCILLVLSLTSVSMADLVAYYSMNEGSGTGVADGSGNSHDGTIAGTPTWVEGAPGDGTAVQFGVGGSGVIDCGEWDTTAPNNALTVCLWVKMSTDTGAPQYQGIICNRNGNADQNWGLETGSTGGFYFGSAGAGGATAYGLGTLNTGGATWQHLAITCDGATVTAYINGVRSGGGAATFSADKTSMVRIGASEEASNVFQGAIDEVYIFNEVLTPDQIASVMNGDMKPAGTPGLASKPNPGNKSTEVSIDAGSISWTPGEYANTQNVFFGTNFDDVNTATVANPLSTTVYQDITSDVNVIDLARLEYGTTYYWRVDEVNAPDKPATIVGPAWNFTTELKGYTLASSHITATANDPAFFDDDAQDPNSTCNGAGLDANDMHSTDRKDMWLAMLPDDGQPGDAYIQYNFDMPYKLNDMKIWNYNEEEPLNSYGAKDINILYSLDGENWTQLGDTVTLEMAPGDNTCTANAPIDMQGVAAKYVKISFLSSFSEGDQIYGISEVQFSTIPTYATLLTPANNATNQALDAALTWTAGRDAAEHDVYYSTDSNNLGSANIVSGDTTFAPTDLQLNQTYYWRVDEVNNAEAYPVWQSPVRSFTTTQSVSVDNFEDYGNTEEDYIWSVWKDGVDVSANGGSVIGKDIVTSGNNSPGLSTDIHHGGTYALPVSFDNTGASSISQVTAQSVDLPIGTANWSIGSPTTLTIWFYGDPNTVVTDDQLYCTIGGKTATYGGSIDALKRPLWYQWDIDLASLGADLSNIPSITIGVKKVDATGGKGLMYIDDIQLTGIAAKAPAEQYWIEAESGSVTAPYQILSDLAGASGGQYVGVPEGTSNSTSASPDPNATDTLTVTVTGGVYQIDYRMYNAGATSYTSDSSWIQIPDAIAVKTVTDANVTLTPAGSIATGWVNTNNMASGAYWHVVTVISGLNGNQAVNWTLSAGTHTIKIANREDGDMIDAIIVRKISD